MIVFIIFIESNSVLIHLVYFLFSQLNNKHDAFVKNIVVASRIILKMIDNQEQDDKNNLKSNWTTARNYIVFNLWFELKHLV